MSSTSGKIVSLAAVAIGAFFLYTSYLTGLQYLSAPGLPQQLFRKEHYEFLLTAKSPFFYAGLVLIGAAIFIRARTKKRS